MKRRRLSNLVLCSAVVCLAPLGCGKNGSGEGAARETEIASHSEMLRHFERQNPEKGIIKWAEADLNNDGRQDCIVMYRVDKDKNMMRVILDLESGYFDTNEVPAPHSDQVIQLRDIDRKPPMEFIVQGAKGARLGFAVFRIEGNRLTDLFGEGMEDCC